MEVSLGRLLQQLLRQAAVFKSLWRDPNVATYVCVCCVSVGERKCPTVWDNNNNKYVVQFEFNWFFSILAPTKQVFFSKSETNLVGRSVENPENPFESSPFAGSSPLAPIVTNETKRRGRPGALRGEYPFTRVTCERATVRAMFRASWARTRGVLHR